MKKSYILLLALVLSYVELSGNGCLKTSDSSEEDNASTFFTTCSSGDVDCFLSAYFMEEDSEDVDLVIITSDLPQASTDGTAPSISTISPEIFSFSSYDDKEEVSLTWTDPNGAQPAFCFRTCKPTVRCASFHVCSRRVPDGLTSGVWRTAMNYTAGPATESTTETMTMEFTPISMPSGEDPVALMEAEEDEEGAGEATFEDLDMSVGETVEMEHQVVALPSSDSGDTGSGEDEGGGTGTEGSSCTSQSSCSAGFACFSTRNCIPSSFSTSCECAGTSSPGECSSFNSTCSSSGGDCGDGVNSCCVGLTCTNGTCEGSSGRCP